jgi:hypothetical protein
MTMLFSRRSGKSFRSCHPHHIDDAATEFPGLVTRLVDKAEPSIDGTEKKDAVSFIILNREHIEYHAETNNRTRLVRLNM